MLQSSYAYWLADKAVAPNQDLAVTDKYSGAILTRVAQADHRTTRSTISLSRKIGR